MKIALVSGASSGMGEEMARQIALRFPSLDEIWITARSEEKLARMEREFPGKMRAFPGDLTGEQVRTELRDALIRKNAEICILVNAAGYGKLGTVGQVSGSDTRGMIALNCTALTALTELSLPFLSAKCRIINFASAAAFLPQPGFAVYAATKAFVLSYSMALAKELEPQQIYVTAVCPGPVDTGFFSVAEEFQKAPFYKKHFMAKTRRVVARALSDAFAGKTVSVYGAAMQSLRVLCKVLPHALILKVFSPCSEANTPRNASKQRSDGCEKGF